MSQNTYMHTYIHAYIHTCACTDIHTYIYMYIPTPVHKDRTNRIDFLNPFSFELEQEDTSNYLHGEL